MADEAQSSGGTQWDDPSLTDAQKLHSKIKGRYSGPNVNNSTYILLDKTIRWPEDEYTYLFRDRLTKDFKCEQNNSKLQGFGPWCSFQDIGRGQEHQCIFDERLKCITAFVNALQAYPPRSPWNAVNTVNDARANTAQTPYRIPLDSIAATQAREEWQRTGEPDLASTYCVPPLSNVEKTLCERGKSGLVSIKAIQKALMKCLTTVNKKCQCTNCEEIPEEDEEHTFDDGDETPDNPTDDPTDDDGDPAPSMTRQSTTISSYEVPIPITFGRISVKGNIIWVGNTATEEVTYVEPITPDTETEPSVVTKTVLTGALAIGLCEGVIEGIAKITFGNRVVYRGGLPEDIDPFDVEVENVRAIYGDLEGIVETARRVTFEVFQGTEDQPMNPRMAEVNGGGVTPNYRGLAYLFIDNVPISEFARDGLPNVTVEVYTRAVEGGMPSLQSVELDDTVMTQYDEPFLALDAHNDRLYVSGGNSGSPNHGVRVLSSRTLVESFQQTPVEAIPASMALTRLNTVVYQEKDFDKSKTHWYAPEFDRDFDTYGSNEVGTGHGESPDSLGTWARQNRGPAILTVTGYSQRFDRRPRWPVELSFFPSLFDDVARFQTYQDTRLNEEIGFRVTGYPDQDPSTCESTCLTSYNESCVDYCTFLANSGGSVGECVYTPPNIVVTDGVVFNLETEEGIGVLDFIDTNGDIYIVGSSTPVGNQDCSGVTAPGDIPPDPLCIADCTLDAEAYCDSFCGSGTRIIEAIVEGFRRETDLNSDTQTAQGALIFYRPYATSAYSSMTSLTIEWLHIASTEDNMATDATFPPAVYRTLPMTLWGNNPSAIVAQIITIPGGAEHVIFIKTTSGPDYAFRYNHANDEVIWETTLASRLPAVFSANDRRVTYPSTDYKYIGATGDIVSLDLAEGTNEVIGTMATSGLPAITGAQVYDPRDQSITYINSAKIVKVFPGRPLIDDVGLDEIAARIFMKAGLSENAFDVSGLASVRVVGYVLEDFGDAKEFLTQVRELFGLYANDVAPASLTPPSPTPFAAVTADVVLGRDADEFVETRKWQDRRFSDVSIVSLNPSDYHTPVTTRASVDERDTAYTGERRFETKFALYPGQAEAIAEQYLALHQVTRGDVAFVIGPQYARVNPGDTFTFAGRDGVARKYVVNGTLVNGLASAITGTTIESLPSLTFVTTPPVRRALKPLRKPVLIFTNAITDVDAKNVINGNQVLYAGIESSVDSFPPRELFAFGRARLTDTVSSGMSPTSAIRIPAIGKALHSGSGFPLSSQAQLNVCDRVNVLTITFDRKASADLLSSASEIDVINDPTRNLIIYDGEQIQFLNVTRITDYKVELSGLYRGRNGTEPLKDIVREQFQQVRAYYYTADTFTSAVVTGDTYAGRPWVEARVADTLVGRDWHVPAVYQAYDYGARLWGPAHITATRLQPKPYSYPDVTITWKPRSPLTERENAEFTPYLAEERYVVYLMSFFQNGTIPIEDIDLAVYRNKPGNLIYYQSPVIKGLRSHTIKEADFRSIFLNANTNDLYIVVVQISPNTGIVGLPGSAISQRP